MASTQVVVNKPSPQDQLEAKFNQILKDSGRTELKISDKSGKISIHRQDGRITLELEPHSRDCDRLDLHFYTAHFAEGPATAIHGHINFHLTDRKSINGQESLEVARRFLDIWRKAENPQVELLKTELPVLSIEERLKIKAQDLNQSLFDDHSQIFAILNELLADRTAVTRAYHPNGSASKSQEIRIEKFEGGDVGICFLVDNYKSGSYLQDGHIIIDSNNSIKYTRAGEQQLNETDSIEKHKTLESWLRNWLQADKEIASSGGKKELLRWS